MPTLKFSASQRATNIAHGGSERRRATGRDLSIFSGRSNHHEARHDRSHIACCDRARAGACEFGPNVRTFCSRCKLERNGCGVACHLSERPLWEGVLETGDAGANDGQKKMQPWIFVAAGAAAAVLLIAAVFYFHGSAASTASTPLPVSTSSSAAQAPTSNAGYDANQSPVSSSMAPGNVAKPMVASRPPATAVRAAESAPVRESKAPAETQETQPAPSGAVSQKAQGGPAPDMFGALNAHPVNAQRRSSSAGAPAAPSLDSGNAPSDSGDLAGIQSASAGPAPPKFVSSGMVRVGGSVKPPALVTSVMPVFPSVAKTAGVEGDVVLDTTIDKMGNVIDAKATSGPQLLRQAAIDAVRRWKYAPSIVDGQPTAVEMTVTIKFHR